VSSLRACYICSSAVQDASSPESNDSGIQTDHNNSTSYIDSLLTYSVTSSCHHGNNNTDYDDDDVDNDDDNNNNHTAAAGVKGQGQADKVQGRNEGQSACECHSLPAANVFAQLVNAGSFSLQQSFIATGNFP